MRKNLKERVFIAAVEPVLLNPVNNKQTVIKESQWDLHKSALHGCQHLNFHNSELYLKL